MATAAGVFSGLKRLLKIEGNQTIEPSSYDLEVAGIVKDHIGRLIFQSMKKKRGQPYDYSLAVTAPAVPPSTNPPPGGQVVNGPDRVGAEAAAVDPKKFSVADKKLAVALWDKMGDVKSSCKLKAIRLAIGGEKEFCATDINRWREQISRGKSGGTRMDQLRKLHRYVKNKVKECRENGVETITPDMVSQWGEEGKEMFMKDHPFTVSKSWNFATRRALGLLCTRGDGKGWSSGKKGGNHKGMSRDEFLEGKVAKEQRQDMIELGLVQQDSDSDYSPQKERGKPAVKPKTSRKGTPKKSAAISQLESIQAVQSISSNSSSYQVQEEPQQQWMVASSSIPCYPVQASNLFQTIHYNHHPEAVGHQQQQHIYSPHATRGQLNLRSCQYGNQWS